MNMPILDKIENHTEKWDVKEIRTLEASQNTIQIIMQEHFLQEQPLVIRKLADFIGLRKEFTVDSKQNEYLAL